MHIFALGSLARLLITEYGVLIDLRLTLLLFSGSAVDLVEPSKIAVSTRQVLLCLGAVNTTVEPHLLLGSSCTPETLFRVFE